MRILSIGIVRASHYSCNNAVYLGRGGSEVVRSIASFCLAAKGRPEERPPSIGSAVQFTHKGNTIQGHLLQRQGRRRFAKIVDTEERTWKVPESALKHSGGVRRATIVTRHDKARADYRVGDEVTFTSPDGSRLAVENTFFRYKSIIVDGLRARSPAGQGSEVVLGCEIFNRMTALGRPVSYRLGR